MPGGRSDLPPESGRIPYAEVAGVLHGGRYRIEAEVGSGSAGTVYRARDVQSGATVALKLVGESSAAHRFEREATTLARLSHPAIVRYIAHGESQGRMFLAMEWLDGEDLETRLARGKLGWEGACVVGLRIAEALEHAHGLGLVHRDLGPRNVFLPERKLELAKLLDFGLVRLIDPTALERTASQAILGTPYYMSPEQIRSSKNVDARADLFSLGVLLYEMASGRRPFEGTELFSLWLNIIEATPPPLDVPGAPPGLVVLIETLLRKDPAARPVSAEVVASLLRDIGTAVLPTAPLAPPLETGPPAPRALGPLSAQPARTAPPLRPLAPLGDPRRQRSIAIAAGVLVGAGLAGVLAYAVRRPAPPPTVVAARPREPVASTSGAPSDEPPPVAPLPVPDDPTASPATPPKMPRSPKGVLPTPSTTGTATPAPSVVPAKPTTDTEPPTLRCGQGQNIVESGRTYGAEMRGQASVLAAGNCRLALSNCVLLGPLSLSVNGAATVVLQGCTVKGNVVITSSNATLTLSGTPVPEERITNRGGTLKSSP